ncbi:MAG: hypothetical protein J6M06_02995, partial [Synergistaceae bacterium]|nr:hypothetical protein [Synergistaceae bacterium]
SFTVITTLHIASIMSLRTLYRLIFGGSNFRQRFWEKWLTYILAFTDMQKFCVIIGLKGGANHAKK